MQVFADATTRPSAGPQQRHREFIVMETPKHKRPSRPLGDGSAGHLDVVFVEPGSVSTMPITMPMPASPSIVVATRPADMPTSIPIISMNLCDRPVGLISAGAGGRTALGCHQAPLPREGWEDASDWVNGQEDAAK